MDNKFFNQIDDDDQIADSNVVSNNSQGLGMQNTPFASMLNDSQTNMQSQYLQPQVVQQPVINQQSQQMYGMQNSPFGSMMGEQVQQPVQPMAQQPVQPIVQPQVAPVAQSVQPVIQPQVTPVQQPVQPVIQPQVTPVQQPVQPVIQPQVVPVEQSVQPEIIGTPGSQPNSYIVDVPQQIFEKGIVPDKKEIFVDKFDLKSLIKPSLITLGISVVLFLVYLFIVGPIIEGILNSMIITAKPSVTDFYGNSKTLVNYINQLKTFFIADHTLITLLVLVAIVVAVFVVKKITPIYGNKNKLAYVGIVAAIALLLNVGMCNLTVSDDQRNALDTLDKMAKLFDSDVSDALESMINVFNNRIIIYLVGTVATTGTVYLITCLKKES